MKNTQKSTSTIIVILIVLALAAGGWYFYSKSKAKVSQPAPSGQPGASTVKVTIDNFGYIPKVITIKSGDTVTWTNNDPVIHNVVFDKQGVLSTGNLTQGMSVSHTFTEKGTFAYHCSYHPNMTGTLIVQ